jgi:hypothetical protein
MTWRAHIHPNHLKAVRLIDAICDDLMDKGIYLPEAYKRRDRREPGREIKEAFEDKIAKVIRKRFRKQSDSLRRHFDVKYISRQKSQHEIPDNILDDAETEAALLALFIAMAEHEIELFTASIDIPLAADAFNTVAIARQQVGALIKNIDDTTRKKVQEAILAFIDTPGQTVGNLMEMLPFGVQRSFTIATSEVTSLYAEMQLEAARELQKLYPDLVVVNTWNTNNDQKVCFICVGLDGVQAAVDGLFQSQGDGQFYARPGEPHPNDRCWLTSRTVVEGLEDII